MGNMQAEPQVAALTTPSGLAPSTMADLGMTTGWVGRKGVKCFFTPMGPIPGPPPPWGMQNVLWRFKWETSDP